VVLEPDDSFADVVVPDGPEKELDRPVAVPANLLDELCNPDRLFLEPDHINLR